MGKKDIYTVIIVTFLILGVIALEAKRSLHETPVTNSKELGENGYRGISSQQLMERMQKGDNFIIVDLRTTEEYKQGHIASAVNLPVADIDNASRHLDKDMEIILYCKSGPWSRQAYKILNTQGFRNVKVLSNGIVGWKWEVNGDVVTSKD